MEDNYEYHKQNDYPGERIAERERVADRAEAADKKANARVTEKGRTEGLKADARVTEKGRLDEKLMDSEIERSTIVASRVSRKRDAADVIGLLVIAGLIIILLAGSAWGFMAIQKQSNELGTLNSQLDKANSDNYQLSITNKQICGETDTNPPIVIYMSPLTSVSPSNTEMEVAVRIPITVMFSEDMNPLTINKNTFKVEQRTTPKPGSVDSQYRSLPIVGTITYSDHKATFTSDDRFYPNQIYGNVFTVTLTKGVEDIAGNPLVNDYVWSFSTGNDPFNTGATTSQTS